MEFGFTLKPDVDLARAASLAALAEENGFTYGWIFDSHVLWKEPYVALTLMAQATKNMRLGTCVTNPATREPSVTASTLATLQLLSGGRFDLGIGRGDSARRVLGKPPTTLAVLEEATRVIKELAEGRPVEYEDKTIQLTWAPQHKLPVWVAGYGPKALEVTARVADGAIIQLADPSLVGWCIGLIREGAKKAGRDPREIRVQAAAAAYVGPREIALERTRWFPALVSNHVVDLVKRYGESGLPKDLTAFVRDRKGYDYQHHAEVGSSNAQFVDDESVERFCIVGDSTAHIKKLRELAKVGVSQFNVYLMNGEEEDQLRLYGEKIIPALRETAAAAIA
ncbi:MAG TPA: TIGR03842 family LLM class F420-dependent oxidoreductase [Candidatus Acidoferrales bacterium]|jgi:probable F420-dependent oxidoreductase|nr:TIGR03842 family LLM class F420-dependent oxidoreductase [Candidatus Acidoferrales bacterium]